MYAVGMLGSYLTQGVYAVAGPFQPFGGAVDIIVVQQEDGTFKSSPWYVKFGDFPGVLKRREKIVDIAVNDVPADFHMFLDNKGEAYFEKEVESDEGMCLTLPDISSSSGDNRADGETERSADAQTEVDASSHAQEATSSKTDFTLPERNGIVDSGLCAEEKNTTGEERLEIQEPSNVVSGDELHLELEEDRVSSDMSTQAGLVASDACNTDFGLGVVHNDNLHMDDVGTSNSLTTTLENAQNLKEASLTSLDLAETVRSNTVVTEDSIFHSSTILPVAGGSCLQAVTFSSAEVVDGLSNDSNIDVDEDDRLLVDVWTEEDIEADGNYEDGLDDVEMFASFECITVEEERETHVYSTEDGMNNDVLDGVRNEEMSKDSKSLINQDLSGGTLAITQDSNFLMEEKSGDKEIDGAASEKEIICKGNEGNVIDDSASQDSLASISSPSRWRLWPFWFRRSRIEKGPLSTSSVSEQALLAAANVAIGSPFTEELLQKSGYYKWQQKTKVRTYVPTSAQLASLNLKDGPNKVTFTFSTVLGNTKMDARIYLWKWNTRIVISDVDGTITKSDVLGQVMPLVGRDWSQYGVTRLFSAIKDNGFEILFLSARAISQAYLTRRFLLNLKQDGEALPEGPVFISPDGLIPSLYREVIRRAPHEFKISCLEGIRELFPKDVNPFYAGFGNRETDEISYLKVGIPKGKIFIINPKGEVVVNHRVDCKSYTSLHALVDDMFPPMSSHEQEDFNAWNFWKIPLPDIDDELSTSGSKNAKRVGSSKK